MSLPLHATASTAGALFGSSSFIVPDYQREYAWTDDEVKQFWSDLQDSLSGEPYFLGLIILAGEDDRKYVVDGQQRIITLSILAATIRQECISRGRRALADVVESTFLKVVSYKTDAKLPRSELSDPDDNSSFSEIIDSDDVALEIPDLENHQDGVSARLWSSYKLLRSSLRAHIKADPFGLLGKWVEFITEKLYFATFNHPDKETAYRVFEVINDRGKDLTNADLLKNYVLSQSGERRIQVYAEWQRLSKMFGRENLNNFVQFIRHVVTVSSGYVLPRDLYSFLKDDAERSGRARLRPLELVEHMTAAAPLYGQMVDPSADGPASAMEAGAFQALDDLSVITVRPILLALHDVPDRDEGVEYLLRLVVRRIVVGSLGTGNIERRFGDAARDIREGGRWQVLQRDLADLNPPKDDFVRQIAKRPMSKKTLSFLRRSIVQNTITPHGIGTLHFISGKNPEEREGEGVGAYHGTIGNSFLSNFDRRPTGVDTWDEFKEVMLPSAIPGERRDLLADRAQWLADDAEQVGQILAAAAGDLWYPAEP
jgi:hypothetical protein